MVTKKERNAYRKEIKIAEEIVEEQEDKVWETTREFYKGNHDFDVESHSDYYVINYIFSNIVSQLPKLTFTAPEFSINPNLETNPVISGQQLEMLRRRADMFQGIINKQRNMHNYRKHFQLGVLDSLLSMGVYKVYHKTTMGKNPKAGKPKIDKDTGQPMTENGEVITHNDKIPKKTNFKVKRVRPENFLVDPRTGNFLEEANWIAEKVYMDTDEAKKKFGKEVESVQKINSDIDGRQMKYPSPFRGLDQEDEDHLNLSVVYEVWDTKNKRKFYMAKGVKDKVYHEKAIPESYTKFADNSPYVPLKYHEIPDRFHPIPDVFPQTQINRSYNKARNDMNDYRDMFKQKFFAQDGQMEEEQLEKLQSSRLGEIIFTDSNPNSNPPIAPVPSPGSVPGQLLQSINLDRQDMRRVSGITELQQGGQTTQGQKATASILANKSSQSKMNWKLMHISNAAQKVGQKLVELIKNRKVLGGAVRSQRNEGPEVLRFTADDLVGDFEVEAEFGSTSPDNKQGEKQEFLEAMRMISSVPQLLRHFDTQSIADQFTKHFPIAKSAINNKGVDQTAFQGQGGRGQGGSSGPPDQQGAVGASAQQQGQGPSTQSPQDGLKDVMRNIQGGVN